MKERPKLRMREEYKCIDCGNSFNALRDNVKRNGYYRCINCGRKSGSEKRKGFPTKHGDAIKSSIFHKLYSVYNSMLYRCNSSHKNYGGRGISVCDEWAASYSAFKVWALSGGYKDGLTIDRRDNEQGYSPDNCRWVGMRTQSGNQRIRATNTSGYTGVRYVKREDKWLVTITIDYENVYIGRLV